MPAKAVNPKAKAKRKAPITGAAAALRFEAAKLDALFVVLDAVAWLEAPSSSQVAQFAGIDPRTAGKLLKNAVQVALVDPLPGSYSLSVPYPYKGSREQKQAVVKEALVRHPLLRSVRQFSRLGDNTEVALRKAATVVGITPFDPANFAPLINWANTLGALDPALIAEDLVEAATQHKEQRHREHKEQRVAFLSHSSHDKPFIRQLAADLTASGIQVWLDEQRIRVGESIPDKIAQGLAESDYFVISVSANSAGSEWVRKELNNALVNEVQKRRVHILPLKLDDTPMPAAIADKKYSDFSNSYKEGLSDLIASIKGDLDV